MEYKYENIMEFRRMLFIYTNEKHENNKANNSQDDKKIVLIGNERDYRGATQDDIYVLEGREGFFQQLSETWDFQIGDVLLGDMRLGEAETGPVWSQDSTHIFFIRSEDRKSTRLN